MSLPRTLPLHPVDLLGGLLLPEPQTYLLVAPPVELSPGRVHARLAPLITESFPRLCYRFPRRFSTWSGLVLADDPTAPVTVHRPDAPLRTALDNYALDDRHWALQVLAHEGLSVLLLRFDHVLGHGELARRFLTACCDALFDAEAGDAPRLKQAQQVQFQQLQATLSARAHTSADWADYRCLTLEHDRVRRLMRAMGMSFSEGLTLWLAYHIQATNRAGGTPRPLEAMGFRMNPSTSLKPPLDPATGNLGLLLERWQMESDGAFTRLDAGPRGSEQGLERFAAAYRALPAKPLLDLLLRLGLTAARRPNLKHDKLVVNNLGRTAYPFFRPIFFDKTNDVDQFGLVYVDGVDDAVQLQFTPPRRYLAHFSWDDFESRVQASLTEPRAWVEG